MLLVHHSGSHLDIRVFLSYKKAITWSLSVAQEELVNLSPSST